MRSRRAITTAIVVAAGAALTAVTIPAFAGSDRESGRPVLDVQLAPEVVAALERDLGMSQTQAQERIQMEAWAAQTAAALRDELGADAYAGAWLTEGAQALTVAVTNEQAAEQVRAAGAEPAMVNYGEAALAAVKASLDEHAGEAADQVLGWYVDVSSNAVTVLAPDGAQEQAREFAVDSGVWGDAVRVVASNEQPRLLEDVRGGDPYIIAGASRCSIGFSVVGGFVTAGHCALAGATTAGIDGTPQGEFVAASFPGVGLNGPDDWGVVAVNEQWIPQPVVNDFEGGTLPVAGSDEAPVGAAVCKYGSTTGVSCGTIQAKNATVAYPEGIVTGLTRTDVCAEPGDSGGSWLAGDQAQGMTSGGSGDCTSGGITFFQPLGEVLDLNELTLITTGEAAAPEAGTEDEITDGVCDSQENIFRGQVTGGTDIQPNGRFYRTLSRGTHTVCLIGPQDSNLDLTLQRWNGEEFQAIADSASATSAELVVFQGEPGFYRIAVTSGDGDSSYVVGLSFTAS